MNTTVAGILSGTGYPINVATADGIFSGSVSFNVIEDLTTMVHIEIQCSSNP
jgi:hypothetical protein